LPDAFDRIIERAMAKDPGDRYGSAGDLGRDALAAAGVTGPVSLGGRFARRSPGAVDSGAPTVA
jgi:hypothetical protein